MSRTSFRVNSSEIAKAKKLDGFLVAMNIEKAFDLLDHDLLILTLEKYSFGKKFYFMGKNFTKRSGVLCYQRWYNYKIFSTWERSSSM